MPPNMNYWMDPGLGAVPQHGFTEDVNFAALASAPPPPPPPPVATSPCVAGPPPPPPHSVAGPPPPHSVAGPPPNPLSGPPPHSVAGPPPLHSVAGPPPLHSVAGPPPPHSVAGPPPPHSVAGPPPPHSVAGPPPLHSVAGPPPLHSVAGPPPSHPPPAPHDNNFRRVNHNYYNKSRSNAKKTVVTQKCEICNIELVGQVVIDAHMKGSKHAKKLKAKELLNNMIDAGQVKVDGAQNDKNGTGMFKCDTCNVALNSSQQLDVHYAGAKHKAKLNETATPQVQQNSSSTTWNNPSANGSNESKGVVPKAEKPKSMIANPLDLVCNICNITVNSPQQLEQHLHSKKHLDRESGRSSQRPTPYSRGGRGGRGGLGSHSRGGKSVPAKFTSLSSSFKSAGYSNSFIKPEGGVSMPANCGTNKGPNQAGPSHQNVGKASNYGNHYKNRGNFGSLTPYVNTDSGRGGYNGRGGAAVSGGGWPNPVDASYGAHPGYGGYDYDQYGYGYGYENSDQYGGYGMMQSGPPPSY
ncbi:hypothetical protein FOCC_FOCC005450 [Frankliniella occidentalis]|nr:hypothetical protein FOCC_FOCC005450 [Frankliniella occidentalis]